MGESSHPFRRHRRGARANQPLSIFFRLCVGARDSNIHSANDVLELECPRHTSRHQWLSGSRAPCIGYRRGLGVDRSSCVIQQSDSQSPNTRIRHRSCFLHPVIWVGCLPRRMAEVSDHKQISATCVLVVYRGALLDSIHGGDTSDHIAGLDCATAWLRSFVKLSDSGMHYFAHVLREFRVVTACEPYITATWNSRTSQRRCSACLFLFHTATHQPCRALRCYLDQRPFQSGHHAPNIGCLRRTGQRRMYALHTPTPYKRNDLPR